VAPLPKRHMNPRLELRAVRALLSGHQKARLSRSREVPVQETAVMAGGQANVSAVREEPEAAIGLYWLPLGAGGHSVRLNGKLFEAAASRLSHRGTCDLYHSALIVHVPEGRFVIEQAPMKKNGLARGVVAEGPVASRAAGRVPLFRYEVRRRRKGVVPDVD
jgi:hypothetical protein